MKKNAFWTTTRDLLRYRSLLALALLGALLNAACFGAGLGMVYPAFTLLTKFQEGITLADLLQQYQDAHPQLEKIVPQLASLAAQLPADPFWAFFCLLSVILVLTAVGNAGRFLHEITTLTIVMRGAMRYRSRMFRRLIQAPLLETLQRPNSDHIARLIADTDVLANGHRAILGRAVGDILKGGAALMLAFYVNWRLTLVALIVAPVLATVLRKFGKVIRRATRNRMIFRGRMIGKLHEALDALAVVKSHEAEGEERRRYSRLNRQMYQQEVRMRMARALSSPAVETLSMIGIVLVSSAAAWAVFRQNVPAEELVTVLVALANGAVSLKPLSTLHNQVHESAAAADRVLELLHFPIEPVGPQARLDKPTLPRHQHSVSFDHLTFTYPGKTEPALRDVSLQVQHGMVVAVVGGNGSGKSTLLSMLPRMLDPQAGAVSIDGHDLRAVNLRSIRRQIAVVTQQSVLFGGSIAQNIAYGRQHTPRTAIEDAAKRAHADDFIRKLPQGYDTLLGEGGVGLSGGQRQRLCIARAILRDPSILILDEATSQIDADSEARINQAVRQLRAGRTIFVIAHRLSTVVDADLIVVMDQAQIVDQGTHEQLLGRCSTYQVLTQTQLVNGRNPAGA